jgi:DNA topoisomerase I
VERVAEILGNTPTICRKSYIHPSVVQAYMDGTLARASGGRNRASGGGAQSALSWEERAFLRFLRTEQGASSTAVRARGKVA